MSLGAEKGKDFFFRPPPPPSLQMERFYVGEEVSLTICMKSNKIVSLILDEISSILTKDEAKRNFFSWDIVWVGCHSSTTKMEWPLNKSLHRKREKKKSCWTLFLSFILFIVVIMLIKFTSHYEEGGVFCLMLKPYNGWKFHITASLYMNLINVIVIHSIQLNNFLSSHNGYSKLKPHYVTCKKKKEIE